MALKGDLRRSHRWVSTSNQPGGNVLGSHKVVLPY